MYCTQPRSAIFDLGKTLEDQEVLLPGARETLQAIQAMRDSSGEAVVMALVSDFDMPSPGQIPIKQVRGIEQFMVRTTEAIRTDFFSAIRAFTQLELMRAAMVN